MQKNETKTLVGEPHKGQGHFKDKGIVIRLEHAWQKQDLEEEARLDGRSLNNYLIRKLGALRGWAHRDPDTGEKIEPVQLAVDQSPQAAP